MASPRKKVDAATLLASAIPDPEKAAAAAATVTDQRENETKGEFVRRMRQEQGLTLKQFATAADISFATATKAETTPDAIKNLNDWIRIAEALKLPRMIFTNVESVPPDAWKDLPQAAAVATAAPPAHPGERRSAYLARMRQVMDLSQAELAKATHGKGGRIVSMANIVNAEGNHIGLANDEELWRTLALALGLPERALLDVPFDIDGAIEDKPRPGETRSAYLHRLMDLRDTDVERLAETLILDEADVRQAVEEPWKLLYADTTIWNALAAALDVTAEDILSAPLHPVDAPWTQPLSDEDVARGKAFLEATADNAGDAGDDEVRLPYSALRRSALNPRKTFDDDALRELADSIAVNGLLQNLVVRMMPDGTATIVAGERRFRAIGILVDEGRWDPDAPLIRARRMQLDDAGHLAMALLENLQRQDVNAMEEADAMAQLQALDPETWRTGQIAASIGCSKRHVQQRLALVNKLHPKAQDLLRQGKLTFNQARVLCTTTLEQQKDLLDKMRTRGEAHGMATAAGLRAELTQNMRPASRAIFDVDAYDAAVPEDKRSITLDNGQRYLPDKALFDTWQRKAAEAKAAAYLEQGWQFAKVVDYFTSYDYLPDLSQDKAIAGIVIEINWQGIVSERIGLVPKPSSLTPEEMAERAAEQEAEKAKREAMIAERRAFKAALGHCLRQNPADAALMMVINMARCDDHDGHLFEGTYYTGSFVPADIFEGRSAPLRAADDLVKKSTSNTGRQRARFDSKSKMAMAIQALMADLETDAPAAAVEALAQAINIPDYQNVHPAWIAYARHRKVPVPPHLDGQMDLEDAVNADDGDDDDDDDGDGHEDEWGLE